MLSSIPPLAWREFRKGQSVLMARLFPSLPQAREKFLCKSSAKMSVWDAVEMLETLVDDSDPDTGVPSCPLWL